MRSIPLVAVLFAALLGAAGCDAINDATAPIDRGDLIDDMASQLTRSKDVLYQADYQLAGGFRASVSQQTSPARTVVEFPGGKMIVTGTERTLCVTDSRPVRCQMRNQPADLPDGYAEATKHGLVTGPVVIDLLRVAALQPGAVVTPHDTTVAGLQASCLEIRGLVDAPTTNFTACVTVDGVLASFIGFVDGTNIDQALVRVNRKVADDLFALPVGADVVDLRQPASPASIG